jgi:serine/threonine-protein kinase RsbW
MPEEEAVIMIWSIPSILGQEKVIMSQLKELLVNLGEPIDKVEDILTSFSEACLNAIEHGNRCDEKLEVTIHMLTRMDRYLFRIFDYGRGIGPNININESQTSEQSRGWGLMFMEKLSDHMEFVKCTDGFYIQLEFIRTMNEGCILDGSIDNR